MKLVLDVGNCSFDHGTIKTFLSEHWEVNVTRCTTLSGALQELETAIYDLVLINRIIEGDGQPGMELVKHIVGSNPDSTVSVVLLTNFPEVQASAMEAGASASFGKRFLQSDEVHQTLNTMLS